MTSSTEGIGLFSFQRSSFDIPEQPSTLSASQVVKKIVVSIFSKLRCMTWGKERQNIVDSHRKLEMLIARDKQQNSAMNCNIETQNIKLNQIGSATRDLFDFVTKEQYKKNALETIQCMLPESKTRPLYSDDTFKLAKKILVDIEKKAFDGFPLTLNLSAI